MTTRPTMTRLTMQNLLADTEISAEEAKLQRHLRLRALQAKILAQAGEDLFQLKVSDEQILTVPRAPFVRWALDRTALRHLAPPWVNVSESGVKLVHDNPNHTDWVIGAGIDPRRSYDTPLMDAAMAEVFEIQQRLGSFQASVVVDAGEVDGVIGDDIVVLPNLHPDHLIQVMGAKAVITEAGGQLAHLAQIAMGRYITMMRHSEASRMFPPGTKVTLKPARGKIQIQEMFG